MPSPAFIFCLDSSARVDGVRLWYLNNRCEVVCLDTDGFRDGKNDKPVKDEEFEEATDPDVLWRFDMMRHLPNREAR